MAESASLSFADCVHKHTDREREKKKTVWKAKVARIGNDNNLNSTLQPTQTRTLVYVCVFILL